MLVEARTVNGLSRTVKGLFKNKPCSINKGGAKGLAKGQQVTYHQYGKRQGTAGC